MYQTIEMKENHWVLIEKRRHQNLSNFERYLQSLIKGDFQEMMKLITEEFVKTIDEEDEFRRYPLHYACENGYDNITKTMMKYQSDIEAKDSRGWRGIHYACNSGKKNVVQVLIEEGCQIEANTNIGVKPIHLVCSNNYLGILEILIEKGCNMEAEDFKRWRPIHYACYNGHKDIVKLLLNQGCDIEAETERGWRPIHCACSNDKRDILQLLILNYCQINCLTKDGKTPLRLATLKKGESCLRFLTYSLRSKETFHKIITAVRDNDIKVFSSLIYIGLLHCDSETKQTVLDIAMEYGNKDIINVIKFKRLEDKEVEEWLDLSPKRLRPCSYRRLQECLLYRSIRYQHGRGFEVFCTPNMVNMKGLFMELSILETAAEFGCAIFVEQILKKTMYADESWNRAIIIADMMQLCAVASLIRNRQKYLKLKNELGTSRLHIAVLDNDASMIEYILANKSLNYDHGDKGLGSALSLAYYMGYSTCRDVLQNYKVDSNTIDKFGRSPLHIAIENGNHNDCDYLLNNINDIEIRNFKNMSVLDESLIRGREILCSKLISKGASFTKRIAGIRELLEHEPTIQPLMPITENENALTLCLKINGTLYECFINALDNYTVNERDGHFNSLLHISSALLRSNDCRNLITRNADVNSRNKKGNTPLLEMLEYNLKAIFLKIKEPLLETIAVLITAKADINSENNHKETALDIASRYKDDDLLLSLIQNKTEITNFSEDLFCRLYHSGYFRFLSLLIPQLSKQIQQMYLTAEIINGSMTEDDINVAKIFFTHAHYAEQEKVLEKMMYKTAIAGDINFLNYILKREVQVISIMDSGETIFTSLLLKRRTDLCQVIIDSINGRKCINTKNKKGNLPIHIVIMTKFYDLIHDIITATKNINEENGDGYTPLALLCIQISESNQPEEITCLKTLIKVIILAQGDIYIKMKNEQIVISSCSNAEIRSSIEKVYHEMQNGNEQRLDESQYCANVKKQSSICKLCKDKPENCLTDCNHAMCMDCSLRLDTCPFCRTKPMQIKKVT